MHVCVRERERRRERENRERNPLSFLSLSLKPNRTNIAFIQGSNIPDIVQMTSSPDIVPQATQSAQSVTPSMFS